MNMIRILACSAVAVMILGGCGSGTPSRPSTSGSPSPSSCPYADSVALKVRQVQAEPLGSTWRVISRATSLGCGTWVRVSGSQAAASLTYSPAGSCVLTEIAGSGQPAALQSRNPAGALFNLDPGQVLCTFPHKKPFDLCGEGTVYPSPGSQALARCQDPLFEVLVYRGTVQVVYGHTHPVTIRPLYMYEYDFRTAKPLPPRRAIFSARDTAVFKQQEAALAEAKGSPPS